MNKGQPAMNSSKQGRDGYENDYCFAGRFAGLASLSPELNTKRLEVLKDAVLMLSRVGRWTPEGRASPQLKELTPAALALKLNLEKIETQPNAKGLEGAFQTAKQKKVDGIMTTVSRSFFCRAKADRRACRQIPVASYLLSEGICRRGRSNVLRGRLH
jgi:hypothetical protein